MKKFFIPLVAIAFVSLFLVSFELFSRSDTDGLEKSGERAIPSENGSLAVFFCPEDDCEKQFLQFIGETRETLHCALYDLDVPSLKEALWEQVATKEVQLAIDEENFKEAADLPSSSVRKAMGYGLMHNKFCIADGKKVITGSTNPTANDFFKNNNNLLIISSKTLAQNYEAEFQELWNGQFGRGASVTNPRITLNGILVEQYFCPEDSCAAHIKEELKKATQNISFMAFSFTHTGIANILLLKHTDGILVRGVMETRLISKDSQFQRLQFQGIDVLRDGNKNTMHHKVFIIDGKTVITGSMNPTKNGDERNDENILIIHDEAIAQQFLAEFEEVYAEAVSG